MSILLICVLIFAVVLLILVIVNVPVSQKVLNILFLVMVILICLERANVLRL